VTQSSPRQLDITGAARKLNVSRKHIWTLIQEAKLSAEKVGGKWIIETKSVNEWEARRGL
jgi:excisionase family DNA binding protein